ncbi:SDR family oxidoreductase [uncultured Hymenobacter sp.]|uniref:SDR family oxidoreductase n=1 Tax=uncultured Hymenobacter sp. TaxID=170016 RepID=UPI0035C9D54A
MKTTGNTILITGGGTGVGLAAGKLFSEKGNHVILVARNAERLAREAAKLPNTTAIACDLADEQDVRRLVRRVKQEHGDLNVLLLNAGVANHYPLFGGEDAFAHSKQEMITNYHSAVLLTQELEPLLREKSEAAIIITTSGVALVPDLMHPTYSATKAALHSLTLAMRLVLERKRSRIKVFELLLPLVDTPFAQAIQSPDKMPAAEVAAAIVAGLEKDEFEMHLGPVAGLYELYLQSPQKALLAINEMTG